MERVISLLKEDTHMMRKLSIQEILAGTAAGHPQSAGVMDVIPLIARSGSSGHYPMDQFAAPALEVSTRGYGNVYLKVRADADRPTIAPTGAGWVTRRA